MITDNTGQKIWPDSSNIWVKLVESGSDGPPSWALKCYKGKVSYVFYSTFMIMSGPINTVFVFICLFVCLFVCLFSFLHFRTIPFVYSDQIYTHGIYSVFNMISELIPNKCSGYFFIFSIFFFILISTFLTKKDEIKAIFISEKQYRPYEPNKQNIFHFSKMYIYSVGKLRSQKIPNK